MASSDVAESFEERSTPFQTLGFIVFIIYQFSGFANEWAERFLGTKAYLSVIALLALPLIWLCCGRPFRGLRNNMGRFWVGYLIFLTVGLPFSYWRRDSLDQLINFIPRGYLQFFYITSFAVTLKRCRQTLYVSLIGAALTLIDCIRFGAVEGSRFAVRDSLFFQNANELALYLLMGISYFLFLFFGTGVVKKVLGGGGILLSLYYILATGSRGAVIAGIVFFLALVVLVRNRVPVIAIGAAVTLIPFLVTPASSLHRISLILTPSENPQTVEDESSIGSQMQRTYLLEKSLEVTIQHPLVGIGLGEFPAYIFGEATKSGKWSSWVGTHNSYTQVSAECGVPAFICYSAVVVYCFLLSYRVYRKSRNSAQTEIAALSLCYLCGTVIYAVGTFFFHMAYTGTLPYLGGQIVALYLATKPMLEGSTVKA